jgi:hypothetical protein
MAKLDMLRIESVLPESEHHGHAAYGILSLHRVLSIDQSNNGTDAKWKHDWPGYASTLRYR